MGIFRWLAQEAKAEWRAYRFTSLVETLSENPCYEERANAAKELGILGEVAAVPELIKALEDSSLSVKMNAAIALGELGSPGAIPALVHAIRAGGDAGQSAVIALGKIDDPSTIHYLARALASDYDGIREHAGSPLVEIGPPAITHILDVLDQHEGADTKKRAIRIIEKIWDNVLQSENSQQLLKEYEGAYNATPLVFVRALRVDAEDVRKVAAAALIKIGAFAVPYLIAETKNWRSDDVKQVIVDIGRLAIPALVEALGDGDAYVRLYAAEALGKIKDASAVPALVKALKDDFVRYDAAGVLGKIGKPAIPALVEVLGDENADVKSSAVWALGEIGDVSAVPALVESLDDENFDRYLRPVAVQAAVALIEIGKPAVPALLEALGAGNAFKKYKAAYTLGYIGDDSTIPVLIEYLGDEDAILRQSVAEALGRIGDASAVPALIEVLNDKDYDVRLRAAKALKNIEKPAVPALIEAFRHGNAEVRWNVARILENIITKSDAIEEIIETEALLKDFYIAVAKKHPERKIEIWMRFAKLIGELSYRKNELASKRDVLLDAKPKPPKRGQMFQAARRVRNG